MYNGQEVNFSTPQYMHAYISQYDLHNADMTVRETIDFSSKMLGTNNEFGEEPSWASCATGVTYILQLLSYMNELIYKTNPNNVTEEVSLKMFKEFLFRVT